ncbi:cell division protein [Solibacillus sp. R5-41]|uniref:FtsW/RodA/SpoVE family cell cycle protein n=1 Tax=Solibacillus sp. R5-41 TaxID=2048654 RepID=UPI000C1280CF|nr:FtsW/RodA/SpoVE family cell cycle protein [Solibacillus sp. R5-41]ATP41258.1 cell division protein [Solibacillus sp. R5-41]
MNISDFLHAVTSYIRSKEAKVHVRQELKQHIENAKKAWLQKGYTESEAEQKAIAEMGSASQLGKSLNKIHKPKWDWLLISLMAVIFLLSFLPLLALPEGLGQYNSSILIEKKVFHILIGFFLIFSFMLIDYRKLLRFDLYFYATGMAILLFLELFPNQFVNGQAIFVMGPIVVQVWVALPFLLVAWAGFFTRRQWKLWQLLTLFFISCYPILANPSLAALLIYIIVVAVLFLCSHYTKKQKIVLLSSFFLVGGSLLGFSISQAMPYQLDRLNGFISPEKNADGSGYYYLLLERALSEGGWFGANEVLLIPDSHTDFAFVQIVHVYGLAVGLLVASILLLVAIRSIWIARFIQNPFGKMLIIGGVTLYSSQFMYAILIVLGLVPIIAIPIPFISYGMVPVTINAFVIGIILSVYRRKSYPKSQFT